MSRFWKITGFDGNQTVYERQIPHDSMSEAEMTALLQLLAATHLDDHEVVSSWLRENDEGDLGHLEVRQNTGGKYALLTTGSPNYTARVVEGEDA